MAKMYMYANHYPTLRTMLMIEDTLKDSDVAISKAELMRRLPRKVMDQTMNMALDYLEERNLIVTGRKGILWIYNPSPKMAETIAKAREV